MIKIKNITNGKEKQIQFNDIKKYASLNKTDTKKLVIEISDEYITDNSKRSLFLAITSGINIKCSFYNVTAEVEAYTNMGFRKALNISNKSDIYKMLNDDLKEILLEQELLKQDIEFLYENIEKVTEEMINFINDYGPAYGIAPIKKGLPISQTDVAYTKMAKYPKERIIKWQRALRDRGTTTKDIQMLYNQIHYYIENNIPMDDNYTLCPICGKPFRKNRAGVTHLMDYPCCQNCLDLFDVNKYNVDSDNDIANEDTTSNIKIEWL